MRNIALALALLVFSMLSVYAQDKPAKVQRYFSDPAVSPDGKEIAFVSGGDIWTVSSDGGAARLLIARAAYDSRPLYSPDGTYLAFNSTVTGNGDIYTYHIKSGTLKRITYDDANEEPSSWSPDGKYIYFSTISHDISGMRDVYRVNTSGGTPVAVTGNRYMNEFFAAASPDGKTVAFNARGIASHQWWRNGRSHIDESEIWLVDDKSSSYRQVTPRGARDLWPMWNKDGSAMYFVSDRTGPQNIYTKPLNGESKQLTNFKAGRVLWPTISGNGETIVFERDFAIWKFNTKTSVVEELKISLMGATDGEAIEHLRSNNQFRDLSLSPDGKKVAFVSHGEIFVAASREAGDAFRVSRTTERESKPIWSANSNQLYYVSEQNGSADIYQYDFPGNKETRLTQAGLDDVSPLLSPDGKLLSFIRNGKELHVMNLATKKDLIVAKGYLGRAPFASSGSVAWSPDSKWLAYAGFGEKTFRNIYITPANGDAEPKPVSFLANTFGGTVSWSADGKYILYTTTQRTESTVLARVDLVPQTPFFREEQFQKLFTDQVTSPASPVNPTAARPGSDSTARNKPDTTKKNTAEKKPVTINFEGIRQRLNIVPLGIDVNYHAVSKDGKLMLISGSSGNQTNLYTYSLDETSREPASLKPLTSGPGGKADAQFSADGKEVFYLEQGRIMSINVDSKQSRPLAVTAEMDVDFATEKMEIFNEVWQAQNKGFYDEKFHGTDWKKVHATYEPLVQGAANGDELRRILNLMVGELNASHSGVAGPPGGGGFTTGKLGLIFNAKEYESAGRYKIEEIIMLSPADLPGTIKVGEYLFAIDEKNIEPGDNIDHLLQNTVGKRVMLSVSSDPTGKNIRKVAVRPVNMATEKGLMYKQWVMQQREYVNKVSNGKLGYVHMADMSEQSLNQLYVDMDAENHSKQGVVVDVRNNNGGFVNPYALDVISRKGYLTMTGRGMPPAPARVQLGQRALDAPTVLVTNQHSLSDAEDFTEGYRTLGLGKVVGEPTAGWIVFTSSVQLIDGSSVRLPFSRIDDHEGKNMELVPRKVDIPVSRMPGEGTEKDSQLDAAVKSLLEDLGKKK